MNKMTHSDAGKLGAAKTNRIIADKKARRIANYDTSPSCCHTCNAINSYENRQRKFCNASCSATFNNKKRRNKNCKICTNKISPKQNYCSNACQLEDRFNTVTLPLIEAGMVWVPNTLKRYLRKCGATSCAICTLSQWMGQELTLQIDHIDGDATNNFPSNLRMICPNCHSQTPTWTGRNRGFGRKSRGIKRLD